MRDLNYSDLMRMQPKKIGEIINQEKQTVTIYKCPLLTEGPLLAAIHDKKVACQTDTYNIKSFFLNSEFNPVFKFGKFSEAWQVGFNTDNEIKIFNHVKEISREPITQIKRYVSNRVKLQLICAASNYAIYIGVNTGLFYAYCDIAAAWYKFN